jgi:hypothetical protein
VGDGLRDVTGVDAELQAALDELTEIWRQPFPMPAYFVISGQAYVTRRKPNPWEREDDSVKRRDFGQFPNDEPW